MIASIKQKIHLFFNEGDERSRKLKRNIVYSGLIKGIAFIISFWLVRITLQYVNATQYGIWATIISIVTWMNNFDIGLGNGLKNKLAQSLALDERQSMVSSVSTTYALMLLVATVAFGVFFIIGSFINWNSLLNLKGAISYNIWPVLLITMGGFCLQFILQPLNNILIATHQTFKFSLLMMLGQALTFVIITVLKQFTTGNLYTLVFVAMGSPVLVYLVAHIYLFSTSLKSLAPSWRFVDKKMAKSLFSVGGSFFLIQVGTLVLYETDALIISNVKGPASVTVFNIAYKYFSILFFSFSVIITPFWSAFTDAFAKRDFAWIRNTMKRMRLLWLAFVAIAAVMLACSSLFFRLWVGAEIRVPLMLSINIALYMLMLLWNDIHTFLLNGTGKLRLQLILCVLAAVANIPLSIWLVGKIGISGTALANFIVLFLANIFFTYQCRLIINEKAKGIWNK
ncbi:O-antigen/teichoic acid export membrane protein [Mucilaginibacter yixingensis]|uniref:O-antigen/teichoic acid export membrane protein n=1 Tax=Mucilaginibacter yixingensis TaxID=1295612 RepID=A0A2T5JC32_9SPHI|nr:oligosaccharide flippase family protein [Mucilaginibacter yixingensis]PTQ99323.1 O-antigen/teichoic acid export membrane protein [Mucilaginibacter yixingensis]